MATKPEETIYSGLTQASIRGIAFMNSLMNSFGGVGAVVRSLPSNPKVPGSIPGSAESGIFGNLLSR